MSERAEPAPSWWRRLYIDAFTIALLCTVGLASVLPVSGQSAMAMDVFTDVAIAALFFMHGAKLSREDIVAGASNLRLHLLVLAFTFIVFPLIGLGGQPLLESWLTPDLLLGVLFLCALPSTIQSSIAFTSVAGGNVSAAVCAASLSSLLGVFLTPAIMGLLAGASRALADPTAAVLEICLQLLVPFIGGHLLRPWIGSWVDRHRGLLKVTDRGTILLVVYTAFSAAIHEGLWSNTPAPALLSVVGVAAVLLAVVMSLTTFVARRLGFAREDEIAIVFCGSKKTLATGIPMAKIMFGGSSLGAIVLPIMIYHQLQLIVCAMVAARYARSV